MQNAKTNTTAVVPFQFNTSEVRGALVENMPWLVAKDVCDVLGIEKYRDAIATLDEDERASILVDTPGGKQTMTAVNESGLYALIFKSRKPEAKAFRKWVTAEVLPALRKTGQYHMPGPEQPGRPGPEWITAKEAAAQWNISYRTARYHLARMAKNGAAEVVNPTNPKTPKYYRQSGGRELQWQDVKANNGIRFIGHVDDKGRITLTELQGEIVVDPKRLARLLADPAFRLADGGDDNRAALLEIASVATLRANYNANVAHAMLYGDALDKRDAARWMTERANA